MTHEAFDELAHAALDGTATPEQRTALETQLASDPRVRERWLDLQTAHGALEQVRAVEPPLDLKPAIMRAVYAEQRSAPFAGASGRLGRALGLRLASAFALGALAAVLIWPLVTGDRTGYGNLPASGAMVPRPGAPTIDRLSLAAGSATMTIELVAIPQGVAARIDVHGGGNAEIVLEHDAKIVSEAVTEIEARSLGAAFTPGKVHLELVDDTRCTILLGGVKGSIRPMRVTLRAGGMTSTGELGSRAR